MCVDHIDTFWSRASMADSAVVTARLDASVADTGAMRG
jgi:hypothetical protein